MLKKTQYIKEEKERKQKIYKEKDIKDSVINPGDSSELPDDFLKVVVLIDNAYLIRLKNYFFNNKFKTTNLRLVLFALAVLVFAVNFREEARFKYNNNFKLLYSNQRLPYAIYK